MCSAWKSGYEIWDCWRSPTFHFISSLGSCCFPSGERCQSNIAAADRFVLIIIKSRVDYMLQEEEIEGIEGGNWEHHVSLVGMKTAGGWSWPQGCQNSMSVCTTLSSTRLGLLIGIVEMSCAGPGIGLDDVCWSLPTQQVLSFCNPGDVWQQLCHRLVSDPSTSCCSCPFSSTSSNFPHPNFSVPRRDS